MAQTKPVGILKETFAEFSQDKVLRLSAALAYYAIFSIGPLLVLIIGVFGLVMGKQQIHDQVQHQIQTSMGARSAQMVDSMMAGNQKGGSLFATIIGGVALILGATGLFGQLQESLNAIWEVHTRPGRGLGSVVRSRLLSLGVVFGIGLLLLISMVASAVMMGMSQQLGQLISIPPWVLQVANYALGLLIVGTLFALIFKYLPDIKIPWRNAWVGGLFTAVLFTIGNYLLGLYLGRQATSSAYGAAGAVVVIMMYVYYSSIILLFGAEFTKVYSTRKGPGIMPARGAIRITEDERAHEGRPSQQRIEDATRRADEGDEGYRKAA